MDSLYRALWQFANGFLRFSVVLIIGVLIVKIILVSIKKMLVKSKVDHTAKTFLFSLLRVILFGIVVITALGTAGVNISSLITALGAAALTAGLAFQDTLKNFVSGMIILLSRPFTAGDLIEIEGVEGYVKSIRIFYVEDENETESALCSPFWYPMILCKKIDSADVDIVACDSLSQAHDEILKWLKDRF